MTQLLAPAPPQPPEDRAQLFTSGLWQRWIAALWSAVNAAPVGGGASRYTNFTSERSAGVTYKAGRSVKSVVVLVSLPVATSAVLTAAGDIVGQFTNAGTGIVGITLQALIPANATYSLTLYGSGVGIAGWHEL